MKTRGQSSGMTAVEQLRIFWILSGRVCGSFGGIAQYLKEQSDKRVCCYVVEPESAAVLGPTSSLPPTGCHRIQGGGYMKSGVDIPLIRPNTDKNDDNNPWIDGYMTVTDEEAIQGARDLAKYEGIFAGYSAGANLIAA
eukprot:CAMPEP_0116118280 /NCGR_PEP_ID=MMETSP0329-20121206/2019_1 /TAXON_ID=697910 /ORGANISM="Pseudo-nitzschia arenysensis, Strain B593" /LENGTH=138 /DNA_ID=CAMNT_0003611895 /DNA_START=60 /DNA_END=472 /DNA_ORIENTATION=+